MSFSATEECDAPNVEQGVQLLTALFDEEDLVLVRPIETWIEGTKKESQTIYACVRHVQASCAKLSGELRRQLAASATTKANIFFAVCPRVGGDGKYDQAWQIRIVRCIWVDVDGATVDEVLHRINNAGLPPPSAVVNSGNGAHVYWLLDELYRIDDAGDPPPVLKEWTKSGDGNKRLRSYITAPDAEERLYLDNPANRPALSAKAVRIQDIIAGVAAAIGGDHTQDVSRLMRVPGTLNRKDERNGRTPVPCELVFCDKTLRHPISSFEKFADRSPQLAARQRIAALPLPAAKPMTPGKRDKLNELVTNCALAAVGTRSEADWRLVCTAIEKGWTNAEVWQAVANVGKFAEAGEAYFERTWAKAEQHTREQCYERATGEKIAGGSLDEEDSKSDAERSDPGLVATLAQIICAADHFAQDAGEKLYRYCGGAYRPKGEGYVKAKVKQLCGSLERLDEWSSHLANEVVEFIRVDSPLLWERPPADVVNVKNGLLRLDTRELSDHSPAHLSAVQLPVVYDPNAICLNVDKFIKEVFPVDAIRLAYEIVAWLMTPDTSIQKAVLLLGPGGNGKSRYLRMIESYLGGSSVSNLSLHRLESDRFACARLYGKLANICPDLPSEHLAGTSVFKAITGGDPVTGEYKFKDSFDFTPFSRLVFSANSPPRAHDASDGFFERWLVVPFDRKFRGEASEIPADKLDALLSDPREQSGLLNRAIEALPSLRSTGRFTPSAFVDAAFSEFHAATDPLTVWLDRHTLEGPRLFVTKRELRSALNDYLELSGRPPMTEKAFGSALKKLRPDVQDGQRKISGRVQWCYLGIGIKSESIRLADPSLEFAEFAEPQPASLDSRDSLDSLSLNLAHAREVASGNGKCDVIAEQDRADRVNLVNGVSGDCHHEYVETTDGDRIRTACRHCDKLLGYRPADAAAGQAKAFDTWGEPA